MREEILDVVNEHDEVIGQQTRADIHQQNRKHRAVHVLVFNHRGELFLQKRSLKKDIHPGVWDSSASGHLNVGEDYDTGAKRELREELGWQAVAPVERLFKIAACPETGQEFVWVYRCEAEGPFCLNPDEIERGDWFAPATVSKWMGKQPEAFAPSLPLIWRRLNE